MPTWLDEKESVAENLGKTDGSTYNAKREGALNRARRKYYSERKWKYLGKLGATLTFTAQVATLPTDYNVKFKPTCVYVYSGNLKYDYRYVEWSDLPAYGTLDYVFALDPVNRQIKISQTLSSLSLDYTYLPVDKTAIDGSQDTDVEPAPEITAISLLGTAYFYLSSRQSKASYEVFLQDYKDQLKLDAADDAGNLAPRFFRQPRTLLNTGYRGLR